jgi:hypothetical protein
MDGEVAAVLREDPPAPTPAPPGADEGPAAAAAEAVTARLQTLFAEPGEAPAAPAQPPATEHRPQADFGPPIALADAAVEAAAAEVAEEPFTLVAPEAADGPGEGAAAEPELDDERPAGSDLFDATTDDDGFDPHDDLTFDPLDDPPEARFAMSDDDQPFNVRSNRAPPLPEQPKGGLFGLAVLALLGLAFFAGGIFWATNASPMVGSPWLDPRVVGWLAGIAGVGFFATALFLLLDRLGRASERRARDGY